MASFLIARLPYEPKSLEAIDFMAKNHFSYRLSSNSVLLNALMSSGADDTRLAAEAGFCEGLESVKDGINLADLLTHIFEPREVKEEDTVEVDDDQKSEERRASLDSVENPLIVNEQLNRFVEAVEDKTAAGDGPLVPLIDQNTLEEPQIDIRSVADDHFPSGNDFRDAADYDEDVVMGNQRIPEESDDDFMDSDDSTLDDKEDDSMDEDLIDEQEENEEDESDQDREEEENDADDSDEEEEEKEVDAHSDGEDEEEQNATASKKKDIQKKDFQRVSDSLSHRLLYVCPVKNCPLSYSIFTRLWEHARTHAYEEKSFCYLCDEEFSYLDEAIDHVRRETSYGLWQHIRQHTGEKPFRCGYCKKRFVYNKSLRRHEKVHTRERPFKCSYCDRRFFKNQNLLDHETAHTGERPYSCKKCSNTYASSVALRVHNARKHKLEKKP